LALEDALHHIDSLDPHFGDKIEMQNYAFEGSLYEFTEEGPLLLPLEYAAVDVAPAYACV